MSNSPTIPLRQNVVYALHQALSQAGACGPREAAAGQARRLADHAADAGMFRSVPEHGELFRFGREPDGRPSPQWHWEDLLAHPEILRRTG
jgi:hypothetical protein